MTTHRNIVIKQRINEQQREQETYVVIHSRQPFYINFGKHIIIITEVKIALFSLDGIPSTRSPLLSSHEFDYQQE
jgi:hypothetical protein